MYSARAARGVVYVAWARESTYRSDVSVSRKLVPKGGWSIHRATRPSSEGGGREPPFEDAIHGVLDGLLHADVEHEEGEVPLHGEDVVDEAFGLDMVSTWSRRCSGGLYARGGRFGRGTSVLSKWASLRGWTKRPTLRPDSVEPAGEAPPVRT